MSLLTPDTPLSPDSLESIFSTSFGGIPRWVHRCISSPGSTSPPRVPITSPSSGVRPIEVSTERPWSIAQTLAPEPRWQVTIFSSTTGRRRCVAARSETYWCDGPWNP